MNTEDFNLRPKYADISETRSEMEPAQLEKSPTAPKGPTWNRILVVHNRLPFKIKNAHDGMPTVIPSSGGLVTAMRPLLQNGVAGKWIGWPGAEVSPDFERRLNRESQHEYEIGVVPLSSQEVRQHYEGYSNEVLTPVFVGHPEKMSVEKAKSDWPTYQKIQKRFADKILEDVRSGDIIWVHDWHLTGVGRELRLRNVNQPMGYFLHIPFPEAKHFGHLPQRTQILEDLLAFDIIGFQTNEFKRNFIDTLKAFTSVTDNDIETVSDTISLVHLGDRTIRLGRFPISIDPNEFNEQLHQSMTQRNIGRLGTIFNERSDVQLIFNAGRQDYAKGFYEELQAFEKLLEKHPELVGKVILYQLVVPSRESIDAYKEYKQKIVELAKQINDRYQQSIVIDTNDAQRPYGSYPNKIVRQVFENQSRPRYLAHLHTASIQSIPTKADGMNLVSKEGAVVGNKSMVQILGRVAGSAEELGDYALLIDPDDIEGFADTLYEAYSMAESERTDRKTALKSVVDSHTVYDWWSKDQGPTFQAVWDEKRVA